MSDSGLRPTCEHHHEEGGGHDHHGPGRAELRASRRAFIKGVIASGVAASSTGYLVLGRGTAHAQAAGAAGRLITLNGNRRDPPVAVLPNQTLGHPPRYKVRPPRHDVGWA